MLKIQLSSIFVFLLLLFGGCETHNQSKTKSEEELSDSLFLLTYNLATPLNPPYSFDSIPSHSELTILLFAESDLVPVYRKSDSLFLTTCLCEYDNFCRFTNKWLQGFEFSLHKRFRLNDSIYALTYTNSTSFARNSFGTTPRVFIATFNLNQSKKPIDKLVLFAYEKDKMQIQTKIDAEYNIESHHYISYKNIYKTYPGYKEDEYDLGFNLKKYRLKENGEFELIRYFAGERRGLFSDGEYFAFSDNDTIVLFEGWVKNEEGEIIQAKSPRMRFPELENFGHP